VGRPDLVRLTGCPRRQDAGGTRQTGVAVQSHRGGSGTRSRCLSLSRAARERRGVSTQRFPGGRGRRRVGSVGCRCGSIGHTKESPNAEGNKITSSDIQQYASLRQQWNDVSGVTVVTTSSYTRNARNRAQELDVNCINGEDIVKIIDRYDAQEILNWYAPGKPSD
jgi:hypothetical protein